MAIAAQRSKICKYAEIEVNIREKARFFELWFEALGNQRTIQMASHVIKANKLRKIIACWRFLSEKRILAAIYHNNVFKQRILPIAFRALVYLAERARYLRQCEAEIQQNRNFILAKEALL
jgi:hypothetical protein